MSGLIIDYGAIRSKSRTTPPTVISGKIDRLFNAAGVQQSTTAIPSYTVADSGESIVYTTSSDSKRQKSNLCHHSKERFNYTGSNQAERLNSIPPGGNAGWYYDSYRHHQQCCSARDSVIVAATTALGQTPGAGYLGAHGQALINSAWDTIRPDLTEMSLPNFLLEIDDIGKLWLSLKKKYSALRHGVRNPSNSLKKTANQVAGQHLEVSFGVLPLYGDIAAIIDVFRSMQEKLAAFESLFGQVIKKTRQMESVSQGVSGTFPWYSGAPNDLIYWTASYTRDVSAGIAYMPERPAVWNGADRQIRAYMDALGFELNPRIIWDAIPFTFVLDWFFDVGGWLNRFRYDALELPIVTVDSYLQCKQVLKIDWNWNRGFDSTLTSVRSGGATFTKEYFHRMPIYPDAATFAGLGWKTPSVKQAVQLVSLVTALSTGNSPSVARH